MKIVQRSRNHRIVAGVCGGLGEYFDIDPVFIRLLFVIVSFFYGIGVVAYIVLWYNYSIHTYGECIYDKRKSI